MIKQSELKMDLQLFNDRDPDPIGTVASLDDLLNGNTDSKDPEPDDQGDNDDQKPEGGNDEPSNPEDNSGGDPSLEPSDQGQPEGDEPEGDVKDKSDGGVPADQAKQNAAFAKLRKEATDYKKAIDSISKALGIEEGQDGDKVKKLVDMAHERLAKQDNVPVEVFKELEQTRTQLASLQQEQNLRTAQSKFMKLQEQFGLEEEQLMQFARTLDTEGISVIEDPKIDLEYEYYKRNRQAIEEQKINAAVEAALKGDKAADKKSTTPSKQSSKGNPEPKKVNSVDALNELLDN